jgi:hypothetical protein
MTMSRCTRAALVALSVFTLGVAGEAVGGGALAFAGQPDAGLADASGSDGAVTQDQSSGTIVLGGSGQQADQTQATLQSNAQQIDPTGGSVDGGVDQSNGQQGTTQQAVDQTESGTFVVFGGGLHQRANQTAVTVQANDQLVDGSTVVGHVDQSNQQTADINQGINQSLTGTFVIFGGTHPASAGLAKSFAALDACGVCSNALSDASVGLVGGDLQQSTAHASTAGVYVVLGNLDQSFSQSSTIDETNDQTVSGTIIIGDVSQANVQHANVDQSIDQSLSGTYLVFGTLDQSADQLALINQSNHQIQGG